MSSTHPHSENHSPTPWTYDYSPYLMRKGASNPTEIDIPAFEIFDAEGNKIFDTNEDSPEALQEANARLAVAAPALLSSLVECARLLADFESSDGEEGQAYRRAVAIIEQAA